MSLISAETATIYFVCPAFRHDPDRAHLCEFCLQGKGILVPPTLEVEIGRIMVGGQPRQKIQETPS
jgi:hypothetical protein